MSYPSSEPCDLPPDPFARWNALDQDSDRAVDLPDRSGNERHIESAHSHAPTNVTIDGYPALEFDYDSGPVRYLYGWWDPVTVENMTALIVADYVHEEGDMVFELAWFGSPLELWLVQEDVDIRTFGVEVDQVQSRSTDPIPHGKALFDAFRQSGSSTGFYNGTEVVVNTHPTSPTTSLRQVEIGYDSKGLRLHEIVVYDRLLSPAETSEARACLATAWGID